MQFRAKFEVARTRTVGTTGRLRLHLVDVGDPSLPLEQRLLSDDNDRQPEMYLDTDNPEITEMLDGLEGLAIGLIFDVPETPDPEPS